MGSQLAERRLGYVDDDRQTELLDVEPRSRTLIQRSRRMGIL